MLLLNKKHARKKLDPKKKENFLATLFFLKKYKWEKKHKTIIAVKRSSRDHKESSSSQEDSESDAECIYCNDMYSNSQEKEGWIQCTKCRNWAHEACSNVTEENDDFVCDICS